MGTGEDLALRIARLERRLEQLIELCRRLLDENRSLRRSQEQLVHERAELISRNDQARARVEAMIARLKAMEQG